MTIVIGILGTEGAVLAADSQAGSNVGVDVKRVDYTKIGHIPIDGRGSRAVTGAGISAYISRAVELLEEKVESNPGQINRTRDVANIAEDVMTELTKRYMVDKAESLGYVRGRQIGKVPTESQDEGGLALDVVLMLAVECQGTRDIYTVYPDSVAEKCDSYAFEGSGAAFAAYLLARLCREPLTVEEAVRAAVYVVEEVKKVDPNCGGPTHVTQISNSETKVLDSRTIADLTEKIQEWDKTLAGEMIRLILS